MSSFFLTGTDTNVGKTVASRAIIQALQNQGIQIVGYKPVAFSREECVYTDMENQQAAESDYDSQDNSDVLTLMKSTHEKVSYQEINSYTFRHSLPVFSVQGKHIRIEKMDADLARLNQKYQSVLVEGSYGWLTPINKTYCFADWAKSHQMPVVLVVGIKEGCLNHALLTVESIQQKGLPLLGWIANRINPCLGHYAEIIDLLSEKIDAPLLGQIPYLHKPEEQDLARYIHNLDRLTYMETVLAE
ncbi:dethiobiotin synthase [Pasteurella multocida]|uniref:ATP-dependent dethiobiotin synthetase BioD n=1 Tax=Pasteurella multocida TaxID=747 RepID=A0AAW8V4X2_PASMD|nr:MULTISPECIES: dethiobiotin synthase [Pasteurella]AMM81538.1 dethiobiotin synthase [Pasteurella multocida subsp. multocida PMTB2.1]APW58150.1 dethiobiotin synthase [Pasteurella multocida]ARB76446.1 dethiobiotin synthase [Pasteurella multocida]ATC21382.1 dethiobiotin synthase [Pasteurella multocida]AXQ72193.1 dethiobiotin synthase [Pasteurella multocida subsp. multocida]